MIFETKNFETNILKKTHTIALSTFFISFLFQTLNYFKTTDPVVTAICAILSATSIIISLYFSSGSISESFMLNSIFMIFYISSMYWDVFSGGYKFFASLLLLAILIFSLYKILKNK